MSTIPEDFKYAKNHEWIKMEDEFTAICGISDHAQEQLTDIVFVELPEINVEISKGDKIADVESVKAVSDIYTPISGKIIEVNKDLEDAPELINSNPYDKGWIFKIEVKHPSELDELMDTAAYSDFIDSEE